MTIEGDPIQASEPARLSPEELQQQFEAGLAEIEEAERAAFEDRNIKLGGVLSRFL